MTKRAVNKFLKEYSPRKTVHSDAEEPNTKASNCLLVVSSTSGFGNASRLAPRVAELLTKTFSSVTVVPTQYGGHCREILKQEEDLTNFDLAVILGGDGAFSEAVNGMLSRSDGASVQLAHAPGGSGCSISGNTLGVWSGKDIEKACEVISKREIANMDVIEMKCSDGVTRYSTSCLAGGVNVDTIDLAYDYRWTYYVFGPTFRYIIGMFKSLLRYGPKDKDRVMKYTINDGEEVFEMETFAFALYNGGRVTHDSQFAQSTPFSRDMELAIGKQYDGFGKYLKYVSTLKNENGVIDPEKYPDLQKVHYGKRNIQSIKVEPVADKTPDSTRPLQIALDGERGAGASDYTTAPFTARLLQGKIQVIVAK